MQAIIRAINIILSPILTLDLASKFSGLTIAGKDAGDAPRRSRLTSCTSTQSGLARRAGWQGVTGLSWVRAADYASLYRLGADLIKRAGQ